MPQNPQIVPLVQSVITSLTPDLFLRRVFFFTSPGELERCEKLQQRKYECVFTEKQLQSFHKDSESFLLTRLCLQLSLYSNF